MCKWKKHSGEFINCNKVIKINITYYNVKYWLVSTTSSESRQHVSRPNVSIYTTFNNEGEGI